MAKQPWLSVTEIYLRLRRLTILEICDLRFAISAICDFEILEKFWRKFWEVRQNPHIPYYSGLKLIILGDLNIDVLRQQPTSQRRYLEEMCSEFY